MKWSLPVLLCLATPVLADDQAVLNFRKDVQPILTKYCYACHGDGESSGKIAFDKLETKEQILDHDLWGRALLNLRARIMPPVDNDRPTPAEMKTLETWIKRDAFGIDTAKPDPGRVTLRRLNRVEYRNTIRDLLGVDYNVDEEFPPDDSGYGFDNIGDVLSVSPMLLEKYMDAAEKIISQGVPTIGRKPGERVISGTALSAGRRGGGGTLTFYAPGKIETDLKVDQPGEYRIVLNFSVNGAFDFTPGLARITFKAGDDQFFQETFGWRDGKRLSYEYKRKWDAGTQHLTIDVQPVNQDGDELTAEQAQEFKYNPNVPNSTNTNIDLRVANITLVGPLAEDKWVTSKEYLKIYPKSVAPTDPAERKAYAREILSKFATRAFRRPVDERTIDKLVSIAESVYTQPGKQFEHGIAQSLVAILASPRFIFRTESTVPEQASEKFGLIDEYALATRLSYFLWSTMPDEELTNLASKGELRRNQDAQVKRMLADSKAQAFIENFAGQWLEVRDVETLPFDPAVILARDAGTETQLKAEQEAAAQGRGARRGNRGNAAQQNPNANLNNPQASAQQQQPQAQVQAQQAPADQQAKPDQSAAPAAQAVAQPATQPKANDPGVAQQIAAQQQTPAAQGQQPQAQQGQPQQQQANAAAGRGIRGNRGNRGNAAAPFQLDGPLRKAMQTETQMTFGYVVREDRPVLELISSNYTFLNARLATFYKIDGVTGEQFRKVELPADSPRGGILTQASTLLVTSNPTRTSPVKRGLFILSNILGTPPPPPPPDIPQIEEAEKSLGHEPTIREALALHRSKPLCQSCHQRMDGLGLALENFNAMGQWRTKERNQDIDSSGELLTGEKLTGVADLKRVLANEHKLDFYRCLTEKVMTYALGRGVESYDTESVDRIVDRLVQNDGKFSAVLMGVIESAPFQQRRNLAQQPSAPTTRQTASIGAQP